MVYGSGAFHGQSVYKTWYPHWIRPCTYLQMQYHQIFVIRTAPLDFSIDKVRSLI